MHIREVHHRTLGDNCCPGAIDLDPADITPRHLPILLVGHAHGPAKINLAAGNLENDTVERYSCRHITSNYRAVFLLFADATCAYGGPRRFLLLQVVDGRALHLFRANAMRKSHVQVAEARSWQLQYGIGAEVFARKVVQGGGPQCSAWSLPQRAPALDRSRGHEILGIELEPDTVVFGDFANVEVELGVAADGTQIEDLCRPLLAGSSSSLLSEHERHLSSVVVETEVCQVRASVIPDILIDDDVVLPVGRSDGDVAQVGEIGKRWFRVRRGGQRQSDQQSRREKLHALADSPSALFLRSPSCNQSRW